ncbi:hypothetical protein ml_17 [Mollivirus sibericum]|uniref:hypothetical protein n=1 Tax=Mollivirus sibericum TaxID=1678078 RepID=UPI0006B2E040|nr:hypothetical protein ml_17 [Mollivirus sibericum]ALD61819.1 hypothetical protein ml_17 [Mollivirus sibericum]
MPNIYVQRYEIRGPEDLIDMVKRNHFHWSYDRNEWEAKGLYDEPDEDVLGDSIMNSGDVIMDRKTMIAFSGYSGWSMHEDRVIQIASHLPRGTTLTVAGFDMDDYPSGGQVLVLEGKTGEVISDTYVAAQIVARLYFPLLFDELSVSTREYRAVKEANKMASEMPLYRVGLKQNECDREGLICELVVEFGGLRDFDDKTNTGTFSWQLGFAEERNSDRDPQHPRRVSVDEIRSDSQADTIFVFDEYEWEGQMVEDFLVIPPRPHEPRRIHGNLTAAALSRGESWPVPSASHVTEIVKELRPEIYASIQRTAELIMNTALKTQALPTRTASS